MRIAEQTESKMVVRSWSAATLLYAVFCLLFGIPMLIRTSHSAVGLLLSIAFIGGGVGCLAAGRSVRVTVDKLRATVEVRSRRLLWVTNRTEAIADVDRIASDQLYGKRLIESEYGHMLLVYKDGSSVVLDREQGRTRMLPGGAMYTQGADRTAESALARFLGVPLDVYPDLPEAVQESKMRQDLSL